MSDAESVQNSRIRDLENRVNKVENDLSAILAELSTIKTLAKGLLMAVALSLGVDVSPMLGA
jgi:archaellum component FlaC